MEYLAGAGLLVTLIGGSAIDSAGTFVPMAVTLIGLVMMTVAAVSFNRR